ncbi:MAG TPA: hypothetical protein PKY29_00655 [Ferruginibacter sp.]|nr:hypothetical protein [Ferruginibacter sp.]HRO17201.1 hypothetical protein [Ferruginibacter sp.]HRQ19788.1 hypothetical protein [Ferruginibacter sp.]
MIEYKHIRQFAWIYASAVVLFFVWMYWNGLHFSAYRPVFFNNQTDLTGNYILLTGIHLKVMQEQWLRVLLDVSFILFPVMLCVLVVRRSTIAHPVSILTAGVALLYAWLYSILGVISIEVFTAFLFTPLVFTALTVQGFYFRIQILRLLFLIIFFSTAWWKFRAGGFFHFEQMQAILFRQHTAAIVYGSNDLSTNLYKFLIAHPSVSFGLYVMATLLEASMAIGFFTHRFDRWLMMFALLFIGMDYLLMEINYFSWIPMVAALYFSGKQWPHVHVSSQIATR